MNSDQCCEYSSNAHFSALIVATWQTSYNAQYTIMSMYWFRRFLRKIIAGRWLNSGTEIYCFLSIIFRWEFLKVRLL